MPGEQSHIAVSGQRSREVTSDPLTSLQAFRDLISCGRLNADQTDVSAYEVDGHVFLAEAFNSLRRRCS